MPQLACLWTTSLTASRTRASKATRSICSPRSCAANRCCTSSGLGKLPVCVVRILFVLVCMGVFLLHEANDAIRLYSHGDLTSIICYMLFGRSFPCAGYLG